MRRSQLKLGVKILKLFQGNAEQLAGLFTSIYISAAIIIVSLRANEIFNLPLNELGDFLAGVFGPLAVLWLVLGYYQQGRELKISSQALVAQCVELSNSVSQQRQALEVSTGQMELAKAKHELEMLEIEESIRPRVDVAYVNSGISNSGEWLNFNFLIINAAAYGLRVCWSDGSAEYEVLTAGYVGAQAREKFQVNFPKNDVDVSFNITVSCKNVRGRPYAYQFTYDSSVGKGLVKAHEPSAPKLVS
ncbi:hypothetical protein [Pseudomonas umsongensis]|uniref:Uncharacterized protein n=1 Tax=Pseudomonas umsongensis TaxID=198618 RepID=A0AAE6ZUN5_9PSED|nr:hypothetical protein [Pseudomonas umsongensis]QJC78923.1 hypothetical protein HGP31_11580 [Pseudomonas umsongensis]